MKFRDGPELTQIIRVDCTTASEFKFMKQDASALYKIAFDKEMGIRLSFARVQMGLRQADLAALLGVTQDHIWRLETGKSSVSVFSVQAFNSVFRGRVKFILFSERAEMYGYLNPSQRIKHAELQKKFWVGK